MKIGVTGANGFIGKSLVKFLISEGFSVTKFTSDSNLKEMTYVNWEDKKQLESNFGNLDVLIHLSWVGSERQLRYIEDVQQINVRRTKTLVSVLNNTSISQIIAFGSQDELKDGSQPWSDDSPFSPISEYGKAKFESFNLFKNHSNSFTWARLFSVYGKNDKRDWILMKACAAIQNNTGLVFGSCAKPWSLTHVSDVSRAISLIIKQNLSGIVNLSALEAPTLKNHLQLLEHLSHKKLFTFLDDSKLEREVSRSTGILESIGWLPLVSREEGFLELLG
jgi:dTDP-6-deoxy-L-talose 4-dehydrogenase (NAD+)